MTELVLRRPAESPRSAWLDGVFRGVTWFFAVVILIILGAIIISLVISAAPAIARFGLGFFISTDWNPVKEVFGALPAVYGTLLTSLFAMLIGIPVMLGVTLYITELCPRWLKRPIGTMIELLAAIPSIIYGIWGLFVFAPWFQSAIEPRLIDSFGDVPLLGALFSGPPLGIGYFTAGLILAIMVLPFMASVTRDVFETVPAVLKESAYGIGATTWEVMWNVVLPTTRVGVIGAIMLGLGRALGETMAVTFVIGNAHRLNASFLLPGTSISATLANEFAEATTVVYRSSLFYLGLILFMITFVVLALAKAMLIRLQQRAGG